METEIRVLENEQMPAYASRQKREEANVTEGKVENPRADFGEGVVTSCP